MDRIELHFPAFPELSENAKIQIGKLGIVHIVAPTRVGKSIHIEECAQDPRFGSVISFMTRPPKLDEPLDAAHFLPDAAETVASLREQVASGRILNITQHPVTGYIYGTYVSEYTHDYNLMPTLTSTISGFRTVPFRTHKTITLTTDPEIWSRRLIEQVEEAPESAQDTLKRLIEAESCYRWAEHDDQTAWLSLAYNHISENAEQLKRMITGGVNHNEILAREEASTMLAAIPGIREHIRQLQ